MIRWDDVLVIQHTHTLPEVVSERRKLKSGSG